MGAGISRTTPVKPLIVFRELPSDTLLNTIEIPEPAVNRRPTDIMCLLVFIALILGLLPLSLYTIKYSDFDRLKGYDQCGNVCGKKNVQNSELPCSGRDFTNKGYLEYKEDLKEVWQLTPRACVRKCSNCTLPNYGQCTPHEEVNKFIMFPDHFYWKVFTCRLAVAYITCLGVIFTVLFLLRIATPAVVWGILSVVCIGSIIILGGIWFIAPDFGVSLILTLIWLCFICSVLRILKEMKLIIQLFIEATNAIFGIHQLLFIPIITSFVAILTTVLFCVTTTFMLTAGRIQKMQKFFYKYDRDPVMIFTIVYNCWLGYLSWKIIKGTQYMIIFGAIIKWYWSNDKKRLNRPVGKSTKICFKYHLGTIIFGSITISWIVIIRIILKCLACNIQPKIIDNCLPVVKSFVKITSKTAYILTAMHGKPFYKSGKRAARIIFQNAVKIASINCTAEFILILVQIVIVLFSFFITRVIFLGTDPALAFIGCIVIFVASIISSSVFFSLVETTIDTIFLCFCEDNILNDGIARPYAMSRNLMEFVENSKTVWVKRIEGVPRDSVIQSTNI